VEAAGRRVRQAILERDKAKAEYERNSGIARDVVSPKVLEDSRFAYESSEEAVLVAQFNEAKAGLDVDRAESAILEMQSTIEEMRLRLEDHNIVAPLTGVLEARYIKGGETISSSTELFVVIDPINLIAYLNRPQREFALVRQAVEVRFTADTYPGEEFIASVDLVSPVVNQTTGSFRLRVRVVGEAQKEKLLPGMFIRARIMTEEKREALMLPKSAVLSEGDVAVVFAVRDGKANRVALDPGLETEDQVECRNRGDDGLSPGDLVVVVGHEDLKDQAQVDIARD
jgi:RND family efflux transporter MFP subunit